MDDRKEGLTGLVEAEPGEGFYRWQIRAALSRCPPSNEASGIGIFPLKRGVAPDSLSLSILGAFDEIQDDSCY